MGCAASSSTFLVEQAAAAGAEGKPAGASPGAARRTLADDVALRRAQVCATRNTQSGAWLVADPTLLPRSQSDPSTVQSYVIPCLSWRYYFQSSLALRAQLHEHYGYENGLRCKTWDPSGGPDDSLSISLYGLQGGDEKAIRLCKRLPAVAGQLAILSLQDNRITDEAGHEIQAVLPALTQLKELYAPLL